MRKRKCRVAKVLVVLYPTSQAIDLRIILKGLSLVKSHLRATGPHKHFDFQTASAYPMSSND